MSKIIFSEGYQFTSDENYFAFLNILKGCNPEVKFALSLSDPGVVDAFRDRFKEVIGIRNIDYLFCNQEEAVALAGQNFKEELRKIAQNFVVTNGSENSNIFENNRFYELDAYKVKAIDSNGAGVPVLFFQHDQEMHADSAEIRDIPGATKFIMHYYNTRVIYNFQSQFMQPDAKISLLIIRGRKTGIKPI